MRLNVDKSVATAHESKFVIQYLDGESMVRQAVSSPQNTCCECYSSPWKLEEIDYPSFSVEPTMSHQSRSDCGTSIAILLCCCDYKFSDFRRGF